MLRLGLLAALFSITHAICPSRYELVRNGECYRDVFEAQNMRVMDIISSIKKECRDGATGVKISNQADNDYWVSVAVENHKKGTNNGYVLLGLECNSMSKWAWSDGSKITFKPEGYDPSLDEGCDKMDDPWAWECMWTIDPATEKWRQFCSLNEHHIVDLYCMYVPKPNPIEADPVCDNFSLDGDDEMCYQVAKTAENYSDASTTCSGFGSNLASIHNDRENTFLRRLAVSKGIISPMMVGASYDNNSKTTKWNDGSKMDYQNYAPGYPTSNGGECVALQTNNVSGQWMNVDCKANYPFACARKTDAVVPKCNGTHTEGDIISSPGFPSSASEKCEFVLKVDPGKLVEVKIIMLEANSCCDNLILTEGSLGGKQIARLSGELENGKTFRTSSENSMGVSWQPNGGINVRGMMITFHSV